jgi:membrane protein DedA with SNARE-associated domain
MELVKRQSRIEWWAVGFLGCAAILISIHFFRAIKPGVAETSEMTPFLLLALSTLVSEDLTSISAGVLASQGRISYATAVFACLIGIYIGDLLLFLAGRFMGRPALRRAPLRWFISGADVERASQWFARRGAAVIFASRFVPGLRLPTYFAAGLLRTSFWRFAFYFLIACAVWTPLLVGSSALVGGELVRSALIENRAIFWRLLPVILILLGMTRLASRLMTHHGRRLLYSSWQRCKRWEFWPPWAFYPPVVIYIGWLAIRFRGVTVFTAANPGIPGGGFIGESKFDILRRLALDDEYRVETLLISRAQGPSERMRRAVDFINAQGGRYPVVLKPDQGQRGTGVAIVGSEAELRSRLSRMEKDLLLQTYIAGEEFGVFYHRAPGDERGAIFAITAKRFPEVTGDGAQTLERLILDDPRAVCMARFFLDRHRARLLEVPASGERVRLAELGTHCRGALFLDGEWARTAELEAAIDQISRKFEGFYFGRYDLRVPAVDDFLRGRNFKVIELNGVTSEATSIYDPRYGLLDAYRLLFRQWRRAFEIGARNIERGAATTPLSTLVGYVKSYRRDAAQSDSKN